MFSSTNTFSDLVNQGLIAQRCARCAEFFWVKKSITNKNPCCRHCLSDARQPYIPAYPYARRLTDEERLEMEHYSPEVTVTKPKKKWSKQSRILKTQRRQMLHAILQRFLRKRDKTGNSIVAFARACGIAPNTVETIYKGTDQARYEEDVLVKVEAEVNRRGWNNIPNLNPIPQKQEQEISPVPTPIKKLASQPELTADEKIQIIKTLDADIVKKLFPNL